MKSLYTYPTFKNIQLEDKSIFEQFRRFPPYSDFNLLSLLSWNSSDSNSFSLLNNNLVLRFKEYLGNRYIYSLLGSEKVDTSVKLLLRDHKCLNMVPEIVVNSLKNRQNYEIDEDRDNFDYVLSVEKITKLKGSEFKPLRRYVHNFAKKYPGYKISVLNASNSSDYDRVLNLTRSWVRQKNFNAQKIEEETKIITLFMDYSRYFDCDLLGLCLRGNLIAYTFNERISKEVAMGHFGKADNSYDGASYFIEYETSKYFFEKGVSMLNHEQDTGIPGLRATKLTYKPIYFLKKYTVTLAQ